ncbi:MAG: hypothetical protein AAF658_20425 [Myxococcota bacterium]
MMSFPSQTSFFLLFATLEMGCVAGPPRPSVLIGEFRSNRPTIGSADGRSSLTEAIEDAVVGAMASCRWDLPANYTSKAEFCPSGATVAVLTVGGGLLGMLAGAGAAGLVKI